MFLKNKQRKKKRKELDKIQYKSQSNIKLIDFFEGSASLHKQRSRHRIKNENLSFPYFSFHYFLSNQTESLKL